MAFFAPNPPASTAGNGALCARGSARRGAARPILGVPFISAAVLAGLLLVVGCDRAPSDQTGARRGATVQVVNASDYEWVITLRRTANGQKRTARLAPRAQQTIILPVGDYLIEQVAAEGVLATELPRRFAVHLEAGQAYRWPVTTLLSRSDGPGDREVRTPAHD